MYISNIELKNFRNYQQEKVVPGKNINLIYGLNAQGKTNLLEALYYLLSSVSYRTRKEKEIVKWGSEGFLLRGEIKNDHYSDNYDNIVIKMMLPNKKNVTVNGNLMRKEEHFSRFPAIVFTPQDIHLVSGGPLERRRFMNTEISRINSLYYHYLLQYYRVLKQRNMVLKNIGHKGRDIHSWDELLQEYGAKIISFRIWHLNNLRDRVSSYIQEFSEGNEDITIKYLPEYYEQETDEEIIKTKIKEKAEINRNEEKRRGYTMAGPHKDDFAIIINGKDMKNFSSQGQQRTMVIALKLAQADILETEKHRKPVLLLDDCFSELDRRRTEMVMEKIKKFQCFITSYEKLTDNTDQEEVKYFYIKKGNVVDG